jgi:hypothetical protein
MENALAGDHNTMNPLVAPTKLSVVTSEYFESVVFYTDGSLIERSAAYAIHQTGVGGFGIKLSSPAGVLSAELSALFMALRHIREVIQPLKNLVNPFHVNFVDHFTIDCSLFYFCIDITKCRSS